jgi:hypothetical protein
MNQSNDVYMRLARQALGRILSSDEEALADALEASFKNGNHDMEKIAGDLREKRIARPSGQFADWTPEILEVELAAINASLDEAYIERGPVESEH